VLRMLSPFLTAETWSSSGAESRGGFRRPFSSTRERGESRWRKCRRTV